MSLSSNNEDSQLSSLELRSKLFHTFRNKGVLQSVKSQLRNRLALELQGQLADTPQPQSQAKSGLFQQISNSLVFDHLQQSQYDYTLSVFITESLTNPEQRINVKDTLQMLNVHPESILHKRIVKRCERLQSNESFLYIFLNSLSSNLSSTSQNISTQTDEEMNGISPLDTKLKKLEMTLKKKFEENGEESLETKLLEYQKKYESQKKAELKVEIERFKSSQLSMMRLEEKSIYDKDLRKIKEQYETIYKKQLSELENKEQHSKQRCEKQRNTVEKEAYDKRQKILSDLQMLKTREMQLNKNNELSMKSLQVEEENLKARREQLRYKEEGMKDIEKRYEERLQNEIIKIKYELQLEEKSHHDQFQKEEQQLREDKINFEAQKDVYIRWKSEAEKLKKLSEEQQMGLIALRETNNGLSRKIAILTERCEKIDNYDDICSTNKLLERDMALLQRNFDEVNLQKAKREKEHQKLVKKMLEKISGCEEMEKLKDRDKDGYFREKYYSLQEKFQVEAFKNEELTKLNEELLLSQRETLREIDELRVALRLAKQEKDKARQLCNQNPPKRNSLSMSQRSILSQTSVGKRPLWTEDDIINHHHDNKNEPRLKHNDDELGGRNEDGDTFDKNDESVLAKLEREAKQLEQTYNDFKERQKQELKSTSRVHFDPFIERRTTSTFNTTDITRTLEIRDNSTFQPGPRNNGNSAALISYGTFPSNDGTILPLSSTQTPGGESGADGNALSFGISLVPQQSNIRYSAPSALTPMETTATARPSVTVATCHSLTQHPLLTDATNNTQQTLNTMYDTRTNNNLTQYPLGETEMNTIFEQNESTPLEQDMIRESQITDASQAVEDLMAQQRPINKTNSVENEYGLKETTIETFESPEKNPTQHREDVFYTPAKGLVLGGSDVVLSGRRAENVKSSISSSSKDDGGSLKEGDLKSEGEASIASSRSSLLSTAGEKSQLAKDDSSSSEVAEEEQRKVVDGKEKENNDMMEKYMQMVLQKKNDQNNQTQDEQQISSKKDEMEDFDIPLSNEDEGNVILDDGSSSEYEW